MKFTTPCFVCVEDATQRKELIEWLISIGYDLSDITKRDIQIDEFTQISTNIRIGRLFVTSDLGSVHRTVGRYDCSTNIDLFKALAAMNENNIIEQWFISHGFKMFKKIKGHVETSARQKSIMAGEWFKPLTNNLEFKWLGNPRYAKATAEQIIQHFK